MHNIERNEHLPDYISKNFEKVNWKHNCNTKHSNKSNFVGLHITENLCGNGEIISSLLGTVELAGNSH